MSIINSSYLYSSVSHTGAVITDRFTSALTNQKFIPFIKSANTYAMCNSVMIEADTVPLYFTPYYSNTPTISLDGGGNPVDFNFVDKPVFYVPAGETITISGASIAGIKLSNAGGATVRYFIQGTGY